MRTESLPATPDGPDQARQGPIGASGARSGRRVWMRWAVAAAVIVCAAAGVFAWRYGSSRERLLARAYTERRPFVYRLPDNGYAAVRVMKGADASQFDLPASLREAVAGIESALGDKPADMRARREKGIALLLERSFEGALAELEPLYRETPDEASLWLPLATAYLLRSEMQIPTAAADAIRALDILLRAERAQPKNRFVLYNLAIAQERIPNQEAAIAAWQQYLAVDGSSGYAVEAREQLKLLEEKNRARERVMKALDPDPRGYLALGPDEYSPDLFLEVAIGRWLPESRHGSTAQVALERLGRELRERSSDPFLMELSNQFQGAHGEMGRAVVLNRSAAVEKGLEAARRAVTGYQATGNRAGYLRARLEAVYGLRRKALLRECLAEGGELHPLLERAAYTSMRVQNHLVLATCSAQSGDAEGAAVHVAEAERVAGEHGLATLELQARANSAESVAYRASAEHAVPLLHTILERYWSGAFPFGLGQQLMVDLNLCAEVMELRHVAHSFDVAAVALVSRTSEHLNHAMAMSHAAASARAIGANREADSHDQQAESILAQYPDARLKAIYAAQVARSRLRTRVTGWVAADGPSVIRDLEQLDPRFLATRAARVERDSLLALACYKQGDYEKARQVAKSLVEDAQPAIPKSASALAHAGARARRSDAHRILAEIQLRNNSDPAAGFWAWQDLLAPSANRTLSGLWAGEHYLSFAVLPAGIRLFSVSGSGIRLHKLGVSVQEVERSLNVLLSAASNPKSDARLIRMEAERLEQKLLGPAAAELSGATVVAVELDGILSRLPLTLLPSLNSRPHVRTIGFHDFAQRRGGAAISVRSPVLLMDNAVPAGPLAPLFPPSSEFSREAAMVQGIFGSVRRLSGRDATAGALRQHSAESVIFHFSGHGTGNGAREALVLTPESAERPFSAMFLAADAERSDFQRTELAVLSACSTASGDARGALNTESLVRGVLSSGARRVVAAQWKVDAQATTALIQEFYKQVVLGVAPADALQRAREAVRAQPQFQHPAHWAAFQMFGGV